MRLSSIEAGIILDNVVSIVLRLSDPIGLAYTSYQRNLEAFGLITSEDILDGVLESILLRGGGYHLLGASKVDQD